MVTGRVTAENCGEGKMASGSMALNSRVAGSPFRIIEPSLTGLHELGLLHGRGREHGAVGLYLAADATTRNRGCLKELRDDLI
jgi:hypothetical protein